MQQNQNIDEDLEANEADQETEEKQDESNAMQIPNFAPLTAMQMSGGKADYRKIPVPPNR